MIMKSIASILSFYRIMLRFAVQCNPFCEAMCVWKTPAESPDCNPIENIWRELKEYMQREVKPKTKEQLVQGIQEFCPTVDIHKCQKYIRHLRKVIPRVIELKGDATGY